jgi:hypothetical protein
VFVVRFYPRADMEKIRIFYRNLRMALVSAEVRPG